jgi:hypothetical protein
VRKQLDAVVREPLLHTGGGMDRRIVPVEKLFLLDHLRPLLLQMSHELVHGHEDVVRIDSGAPGDDVGVDQPFAVEECQQHLFRPAGVNLCLDRAWQALFNPLFGGLFYLRRMVGNHRLVHRYNSVQHRHGAPVDGGDELRASSHSLLLLVFREKFWNPAGGLFDEAQTSCRILFIVL